MRNASSGSHLRYPEPSLVAHKEGKVWFTVKIDEDGKLVGFHPVPDNDPGAQTPFKVVVISRPATEAEIRKVDKKA